MRTYSGLVYTCVVTVTVSASEEEAHYAQSISAPRHLWRSRNRDENARGPEWLTRARPSPLVIFDTVSPVVASVIADTRKLGFDAAWNRIGSGLNKEILFSKKCRPVYKLLPSFLSSKILVWELFFPRLRILSKKVNVIYFAFISYKLMYGPWDSIWK